MSLIDRYVAEVGRRLPEKNREDIEAEIRSTVEDMIEERGHQSRPADNKIIAEALEGLGDPKLLASKYAPPKHYLIGPDWYEMYLIILKRVLGTALPVVAIVAFILSLTKDPIDFVNAVGQALGSVIDIGIGILFWVTVAFIILERSDAKPKEAGSSKASPWTVSQLPAMPKRRQISVPETVINIASLIFVMIWFVLPSILSAFQGESVPVPFLHPNLWNLWLPILFLLMALSAILETFKLKIGMWTRALTIANVILCVISIIYIAALVTTQEVIDPEFLAMLDQNGAQKFREVVTWSINISAAIIAGTYVWSIVDSIRLSKQLTQTS